MERVSKVQITIGGLARRSQFFLELPCSAYCLVAAPQLQALRRGSPRSATCRWNGQKLNSATLTD